MIRDWSENPNLGGQFQMAQSEEIIFNGGSFQNRLASLEPKNDQGSTAARRGITSGRFLADIYELAHPCLAGA